MTSDLDSHTATDVKQDMLSGVQTGNGIPHDRYNIRGIAHVRTNRKDDIFMQRRLYIDAEHIGNALTTAVQSFFRKGKNSLAESQK